MKSNSAVKMRIIISDSKTGKIIREHDETGKVVKNYEEERK
jgi:hypothetical protein